MIQEPYIADHLIRHRHMLLQRCYDAVKSVEHRYYKVSPVLVLVPHHFSTSQLLWCCLDSSTSRLSTTSTKWKLGTEPSTSSTPTSSSSSSRNAATTRRHIRVDAVFRTPSFHRPASSVRTALSLVSMTTATTKKKQEVILCANALASQDLLQTPASRKTPGLT